MVLPLYDDNADRRSPPYVNYCLIIVNVWALCGHPGRAGL